jgi:hypothetical protein
VRATTYACTTDRCIACSDEGVPMTVLGTNADTGLARCAGKDGRLHVVEVGLIDAAAPGAVVLVHADVAIAVLEPAAASAAPKPATPRTATSATVATSAGPEGAR